MALQVTSHVALAELDCKDGTPYPAEWLETRAKPLAQEFEKIRAEVGKPIIIGSAYRTPAYNRKVGGAANSQHCQGRALDLYPPKGWTVDDFYNVIRSVASRSDSKIYGLGKYPTFVHIDIRPPRADGRLTVWRGSRAWAELK